VAKHQTLILIRPYLHLYATVVLNTIGNVRITGFTGIYCNWLCLLLGTEWVEMHKLAERIELEELVKCGLLHGDIEEMMKVRWYNFHAIYTTSVLFRSTWVLFLCHMAWGISLAVMYMMSAAIHRYMYTLRLLLLLLCGVIFVKGR